MVQFEHCQSAGTIREAVRSLDIIVALGLKQVGRGGGGDRAIALGVEASENPVLKRCMVDAVTSRRDVGAGAGAGASGLEASFLLIPGEIKAFVESGGHVESVHLFPVSGDMAGANLLRQTSIFWGLMVRMVTESKEQRSKGSQTMLLDKCHICLSARL